MPQDLQRRRLQVSEVEPRPGLSQRDLVTGGGSQLLGVARAADVPHQRQVEGETPLALVQPRPLGEPGGQQGRLSPSSNGWPNAR